MFDRNSLVTRLGWRLGIVLSIGTLLQMAWLFVHFRGAETGYARAGLFCELFAVVSQRYSNKLNWLGDIRSPEACGRWERS
jgi:hypothetical protein